MSGRAIPLIYNPDLVHRDTLVQSFVVREDLLAEVVDDLRRTTKTRQHHVFIGQRGMGKSTLLHRIAYAIDDDAALGRRWVPLLFPEEQYNVRRLSDLLSNTVDALAARLEKVQRAPDAAALDVAVQGIEGDEETKQERLLNLLRGHAKKERARMVLLVDNLDLTLERIGEKPQWRLREIMQQEDWLVLIGAGTSMHESTWDYGRAFYDFFQVHELKGLDLGETRRLFARLAEMHHADTVRRSLGQVPAKIRALHRLTGGNPRTLSLLFNVLQRGALSDISDDLTGLLDLCTPLYKHRLESLPAQQQRVVDALALHWAPMTAGELATALGEGVNDVSSQLSRLVRDGVVETTELPDTTKAGHQIAERFFNVWYLMRAGRRLRKQLDWLVQFLKEFYEADELESLVREEVARHREGKVSPKRLPVLVAYADALPTGPVKRAALAEAVNLATWRGDVGVTGKDYFDFGGEDRDLAEGAARIETMKRAKAAVDRLKTVPRGITRDEIWRWLGSFRSDAAVKKHARTLNTLTAAELASEVRSLDPDFTMIARIWGSAFAAQITRALQDGSIHGFGDIEWARRRESLTPTGDWVGCALVLLLRAHGMNLESYLKGARHLKGDFESASLQSWIFILAMFGSEPRIAKADARLRRSVADFLKSVRAPVGLLAATLDDLSRIAPALREPVAFVVDALATSLSTRPELAADIALSHFAGGLLRLSTDDPGSATADLAVPPSMAPNDAAALRLLPSATSVARLAIESSRVPEYRAFLDRLGLALHWRPLAAALDCVIARDRSRLARLPAEIHAAADEVLTALGVELPAPALKQKRPRARPRP